MSDAIEKVRRFCDAWESGRNSDYPVGGMVVAFRILDAKHDRLVAALERIRGGNHRCKSAAELMDWAHDEAGDALEKSPESPPLTGDSPVSG